MELFRGTHIDFLRIKWVCISISWALILVGIVSIAAHGGLRLGLDFTGGTQIVLRFHDKPEPSRIEGILRPLALGLEGVQRYDVPEKNEVLIKVKQQAREGRDVTQDVFNALSQALGSAPAGKVDVNVKGRDALASGLAAADPDHVAARGIDVNKYYLQLSDAVMAKRSEIGIFRSASDFDSVPGVSEPVRGWLKANTFAGPFTILSADNIGPQVGHELRSKALWAILLSTLAMLLYIWFRFDVKFGVGAIIAVIHDTLITIGVLSLLNREFTLVVVAALLTLVGYSMNDTVVVYDRIRENMRNNRRDPLAKIINDSINQTLSRTVMSSGLTFLTCLALLLLGGEVLRTFALTLVIGIIVGTYSSIYVASPIVVIWNEWQTRRAALARAGAPSGSGRKSSGKR